MSLPWFKVYVGTPDHAKVAALMHELGEPLADAYVLRLWDFCGAKYPDGRIQGRSPTFLLERALRWHGEPGRLVQAMIVVGLLDHDGDGYLVHDWEEIQSAHVAKVQRDRAKPPGRERKKRPSNVPPMSLKGHERESSNVPPMSPEGSSPLSTLVVASKGVQGETRVGVLRDDMDAAWASSRGGAYSWTFADERAVSELMRKSGGDNALILVRWGHALARTTFPICTSVADLAKHWNAYAAAPPSKPRDVTRGRVGAEEVPPNAHEVVGEIEF